jgi:soluble lytic murein transglycosylase-like protein
MMRRSDGVYVLSNNPDKPRAPMVGMVGIGQSGRGFGRSVAVPAFLRERIDDHARAQDLDPKLVEALIRVESAFNSGAVSNKGAMGLMQLMPGTALELGVENAFDVEENLRGGTVYLRSLLDRFNGDLTLALAGYNAGPAAVEKYRGVPPYRETTEYVRRVLAAYGTTPKSSRRSSTTGTMTIRVAAPPATAPAAARTASGAGS